MRSGVGANSNDDKDEGSTNITSQKVGDHEDAEGDIRLKETRVSSSAKKKKKNPQPLKAIGSNLRQ